MTVKSTHQNAHVHHAMTRRSAVICLAAGFGLTGYLTAADRGLAQAGNQAPKGANTMDRQANHQKAIHDLVNNAGLLVIAQWEAKPEHAEAVDAILKRFQPLAQLDPGVRIFLIARGTENTAQFLFYELFENEAAFKSHQETEHFKSLVAGQALPLLARRERTQYRLI